MLSGADALADLSFAQRARSVVAASSSLAWVSADGDAGVAPYYEECGSPMMLASDEAAYLLVEASAGRVELGLHPRIGIVRLSGQFWQLAGFEAREVLETERRRHAECADCPAWQFSRVIGLQVVTIAIRLPGEPDYRPIELDDYVLAEPEPMVAVGATMAAHLNTDHEIEIAEFAATVLRKPIGSVLGARVGVVDAAGFDLSVVDTFGGQDLRVPFHRPLSTPADLPEAMHAVIANAISS